MSCARLALPVLLGALLMASGCASGDYYVRSDPPQTPAADNAAAEMQPHTSIDLIEIGI